MTAATKDIKSDQLDTPDAVYPRFLTFPVEANTTIFAGTMVATNAAGNAVPATASSALRIWGRCERTVTQGAVAGVTSPPFLVHSGAFYLNNGAGLQAIAAGDVGKYCFAVDDNTVGISDAAGTLPLAGVILAIGLTGEETGKIAVGLGMASPYQGNPLLASSSTAFRARNIAAAGNVASLAAFTVAGNDGVTNVANDVIILAEQTLPAQNGPYVVGTVALGVAPLTRPDWWPTGATLPTGLAISIGGEGTVFKNTRWRAMLAAATFLVGTTDPKLYPDEVNGVTALVAGTFTIATVPLFSANSQVALTRKIANTSTLTVGGYHPTVGGANGITAGVRGAAAAIVEATVGAGTINVADISTLHWTVINQA